MKRAANCFSLFVLAAMMFFFSSFATPGIGEAATKVRVAMGWVLAGDSVPEFVALEKGFFAVEGIETTIQRGHGAVDTLKRVAAGDLHLGSSVLVSVALGRAAGRDENNRNALYLWAVPPSHTMADTGREGINNASGE